MPQMDPMNWLFLFLYVVWILLGIMSLIFWMKNYSDVSIFSENSFYHKLKKIMW